MSDQPHRCVRGYPGCDGNGISQVEFGFWVCGNCSSHPAEIDTRARAREILRQQQMALARALALAQDPVLPPVQDQDQAQDQPRPN